MGKPRIPYYEGDSRVQRHEIRRIQAQHNEVRDRDPRTWGNRAFPGADHGREPDDHHPQGGGDRQGVEPAGRDDGCCEGRGHSHRCESYPTWGVGPVPVMQARESRPNRTACRGSRTPDRYPRRHETTDRNHRHRRHRLPWRLM